MSVDALGDDVEFDIELTNEEWQLINPIGVQEKDRIQFRMKKGWGDIIIDAIWRVKKIPCPFNFDKQYFYKRKNYPYFIFEGGCKCSNKISGKCLQKPVDGDNVKIHINTKNTVGIIHNNCRRLANVRRQAAKEILLHKQPILFKHTNAAKNLNDSGTGPPFNHSTPVLKMARQEAKDEILNLTDYPGNPLDSLMLIMNKNPSVRKVSSDPIIVWYWSENQIQLSHEVNHLKLPYSIDAAGRFANKVSIVDDRFSGPIFLYNIAVQIQHKIFSLTQMLSSKHDTETILMWLLAWIQSGASVPHEVVSDCSKALLNALCLAFNRMYYSQYLDSCLEVLVNCSTVLPRTLVKRDRNHLIKTVTRWKVFHSTKPKINPRVKEFYVRAIAYSLEITDVIALQKVILALFIVCQGQVIDNSSNCGQYLSYLDEKIATFNYEEPKDLDNQCSIINSESNQSKVLSDGIKYSNILTFIKNIKLESEKIVKGDNEKGYTKINPYHAPALAENLETLYAEFPAWTSVMHRFFPDKTNNVSTSSASENYFRIMRSNYEIQRVETINRFLLNHLNILSGATKKARSLIKKIDSDMISTRIKADQSVPQKGISSESIYIKENIKAELTVKQKIRQENNIEVELFCDAIDKSVPIQNGSQTEAVNIKSKKVKLTNTCAFDSIFELMVHSAKNYKPTWEYYDKFQNETTIFKLFYLYITDQLSYQQLYTFRAELIYSYLGLNQNENYTTINCETNINALVHRLLGSTQGSSNLRSCEECLWSKNEKGRPLVVSSYNCKLNEKMSCKDYMNQCIEVSFNGIQLTCKNKCDDMSTSRVYIIHSFIIIDIEGSFLSYPNLYCDTSDIPLVKQYSNYTLHLSGCIARKDLGDEKGHYVSYLYNNLDNNWEMRDDTKQVTFTQEHFYQLKLQLIVYCIK